MDNLTDIESIIKSQSWKKSKTSLGPSMHSMDHLTDIESIINTQSWKKSKTSVTPSTNLKSVPNTKQVTESPSLKALNSISESKTEAAKNERFAAENEDRVTELTKLAVPYKTLAEAVNRSVVYKTPSVLVPAFPMRKFGCAILNSFQPVFEKLDGKEADDQEIFFIKKNCGRAQSIKAKNLKGMFSPRNSK